MIIFPKINNIYFTINDIYTDNKSFTLTENRQPQKEIS